MRKGLRMLLLGAVFTVLLCTSALAADSGIVAGTLNPATGLIGVTDVVLEAQKADGTKVDQGTSSGEQSVLADTVRVGMTVSGTKQNSQYLAFVLKDNTGVPTASNIVYIDQVQASGSEANFNLYPSSLASGTTYHIYLSSNTDNGTLKEVGSFDYYAPYQRGDLDGDNDVSVGEATQTLRFAVNLDKETATEQELYAADANGDGTIDVGDATTVLRAAVKLEKFDWQTK